MSTLSEIEMALESLPLSQQQALFAFLAARLHHAKDSGQQRRLRDSDQTRHSVLDISPAHLGRVLRPLSVDDDLLGEMLEGRR